MQLRGVQTLISLLPGFPFMIFIQSEQKMWWRNLTMGKKTTKQKPPPPGRLLYSRFFGGKANMGENLLYNTVTETRSGFALIDFLVYKCTRMHTFGSLVKLKTKYDYLFSFYNFSEMFGTGKVFLKKKNVQILTAEVVFNTVIIFSSKNGNTLCGSFWLEGLKAETSICLIYLKPKLTAPVINVKQDSIRLYATFWKKGENTKRKQINK